MRAHLGVHACRGVGVVGIGCCHAEQWRKWQIGGGEGRHTARACNLYLQPPAASGGGLDEDQLHGHGIVWGIPGHHDGGCLEPRPGGCGGARVRSLRDGRWGMGNEGRLVGKGYVARGVMGDVQCIMGSEGRAAREKAVCNALY